MNIKDYSNDTRRAIKKYIDVKGLKTDSEGYNAVLDKIDPLLKESRLRTTEEKEADKEGLNTWLL